MSDFYRETQRHTESVERVWSVVPRGTGPKAGWHSGRLNIEFCSLHVSTAKTLQRYWRATAEVRERHCEDVLGM